MQPEPRPNSPFGGVFGPLAQYPGASYGKLLKSVPEAGHILPNRGTPKASYGVRRMSTAPLQHIFSSVLLLVDAESNAIVDRRVLREVGLNQVRVLTSGVQAARLLVEEAENGADHPIDLVLCHHKLSDMNGAQLAALLRLHPRLLGVTVLAVVGNHSEAASLHALASGFSGVLVRPYSPESLGKVLHGLSQDQGGQSEQNLRQGNARLSASAFDAALSQYEKTLGETLTPEKAFHTGLQFLHKRQWDGAIQSFQRALHQLSLKGEAELGLAAAWRGKGDLQKYRHYLNEAGHSFARATLWQKARVAYARLLLQDPLAPSPFLAAAESAIRDGRYEEAAEALAEGYDSLPEEETVPKRLAQACIFTENPEFSAVKVQKALKDTALAPCADAMGGHIQEALQEQDRVSAVRREALAQRQAEEALDAHAVLTFELDFAPPSLSTLEGNPRSSQERTAPSTNGQALSSSALQAAKEAKSTTPQKACEPRGVGTLGIEEPVLAPLKPLSEDEAESSLFSSFPGLNEALTVAKVTWKLLKR